MARKSGKGKRVSGKGKRTSGKKAAVSARKKSVSAKQKRTSGKSARASSRRSGKHKQARVGILAAGTGLRVDLICRECLEDWNADADAARAADAITCPVCEHRAQRPSDDILHQIRLYKGMERRSLKAAIASVLVAIASYLAWLVLTHTGNNANEPALFYGPLAVTALAFLAAIFFAARYERSRWETYF
ncbi:MAG: hypothetical protein D6776_00570 [Planctomycetota bacterium]|nr:MAG: hypothetical protein D6776_00570 [Planctomycetota bacterium]